MLKEQNKYTGVGGDPELRGERGAIVQQGFLTSQQT